LIVGGQPLLSEVDYRAIKHWWFWPADARVMAP